MPRKRDYRTISRHIRCESLSPLIFSIKALHLLMCNTYSVTLILGQHDSMTEDKSG